MTFKISIFDIFLMLLLYLFSLSFSKLQKYNVKNFRKTRYSEKPVIGYFYHTSDKKLLEKNLEILENVSNYFPNLEFVSHDCGNNHDPCDDFIINSNSVYIIGRAYRKPIQHINEFSYYSLFDFIQSNTNEYPVKYTISEPFELKPENITSFIQNSKCAAVFYINLRTYSSNLLLPTIKEVFHTYLFDEKVDTAFVDCTNDFEICFKMNVESAPILRVYKDLNTYNTFKGTRETPFLLDFINNECGTYRLPLGEIDIHNLESQKIKSRLYKFYEDPDGVINDIQKSNIDYKDLYLRVLIRMKDKSKKFIRSDLKKCISLLKYEEINGPSLDKILITKHILEILLSQGYSSADKNL